MPIDYVWAAPFEGGIDGVWDCLLDFLEGEVVFGHAEFADIDILVAEVGAVGHVLCDEVECSAEYVWVVVFVGGRIPC